MKGEHYLELILLWNISCDTFVEFVYQLNRETKCHRH